MNELMFLGALVVSAVLIAIFGGDDDDARIR